MLRVLLAVVLLAGCAAPAPPATGADDRPAEWIEDTLERPEGALRYVLRVPAGDRLDPRPLVLMLHGGGESPEAMIDYSRMADLADAEGFLVVFPEVPAPPPAGEPRAWRWWDRAHQERGAGQPLLLVALVAEVDAVSRVDGDRVYVAGFSAGGLMASILGATYPDVFRAIGIHSGGEYRAADSEADVPKVMVLGGPDPKRQADLAVAASGAAARPVRAIVFHGDADRNAAPVNGAQAVEQWRLARRALGAADAAPATREGEEEGHAYTVVCHGVGVEGWTVHEKGHVWSGDPVETIPPREATAGPSATREMWRFFTGVGSGCAQP